MNTTLQADGSFNVVVDIKHADGDRRFVTNTKDPEAYYTRIRELVENPPERDLEGEKESLLAQKAFIDSEIVKVDAEISIKEAPPKEVIG